MPASKPSPSRRPATLDHLRKKRTLSQVVAFCVDDIPEPQVPGRKATPEQRKAFEEAHAKWQAEVEAATVEFVIRSMSRRAYQDLVDSCPPTPEQVERAKTQGLSPPDNNEEKFGPALIAASIVEPAGVTLDDAQTIWDEWPNADVRMLGTACLILNQTSRLDYYQSKSAGMGG